MREYRRQADCHVLVSGCINGGSFFKASAVKASVAYASWAAEAAQHAAPRLVVEVANYEGESMPVQRLASYLNEYGREELLAAVAHGSIGTGEEIAYSDFDALIIIRDQTMRDPRRLAVLAHRLSRARQFMFEYDPLQHHGWFVLTEADLRCYNEALFPHEILEHARVICHRGNLRLELCPRDSAAEVRQAFLSVARSLQANLLQGWALYNMYHLKNTLSLFMLLPSLYVHVRDGRGIFKKFSFEAARPDFTEQEWEPMARVSQIRQLWRSEMSPLKRWLLSRPWKIRRRLVRHFAPSVPSQLRVLMAPELREGMMRLTVRMTEKLRLGQPVGGTPD